MQMRRCVNNKDVNSLSFGEGWGEAYDQYYTQ